PWSAVDGAGFDGALSTLVGGEHGPWGGASSGGAAVGLCAPGRCRGDGQGYQTRSRRRLRATPGGEGDPPGLWLPGELPAGADHSGPAAGAGPHGRARRDVVLSHEVSMRLYVISYDIADDARRTDVADALLSYGRRIQYSVF